VVKRLLVMRNPANRVSGLPLAVLYFHFALDAASGVNSPRTFIDVGLHAFTRSRRMRFTAFS